MTGLGELAAGGSPDATSRGAQGETARERLEHGEQISAYQRRCLGFLEMFEQVDAENAVYAAGKHQAGAFDGETKTTVTSREVMVDGKIVTLTDTRVEHLPPDHRSQEFIMRSRWPDTWNPASAVEVAGKGGGPVEVSLPELVAKLRELQGTPEEL